MTTATSNVPQCGPSVKQGRSASQGSSPPARRKVAFGPIQPQGHRIVLYGPGGIGKTTMSCHAPGPVAIFDLDESLPVLRSQLSNNDQVNRIVVGSWNELRQTLHMEGWDEIRTIVVDSVTRAEEMAAQWVLENIPLDNGKRPQRLEDYGWGRQFSYIYDTFLSLLGDLDAHVRAGRHVILIAHDCTTEVPNPGGPNWLRYEPRLQAPGSGKYSIRLRVREWSDHVLYFGYDGGEFKDGKMTRGCETRTIYPLEMPHCMAKSRTCDTAMPVARNDASVWQKIITV
ncbi:MAG: AAA family ATPase [Planctomycetes bacterium]|nr:AAA family ATPase [Planctomycetota bacterium]